MQKVRKFVENCISAPPIAYLGPFERGQSQHANETEQKEKHIDNILGFGKSPIAV